MKNHKINAKIANRFSASSANPTVQPDGETEMHVPIPSEENIEYSKEYQEENKR